MATAPKATSILKLLGGISKGVPNGMSDSVKATVDGKDPAALSQGEYVVTADVVSLIGDGDNGAGATILDETIAKLRQAKTGQKEQPNPMAQLFAGGKVKSA